MMSSRKKVLDAIIGNLKSPEALKGQLIRPFRSFFRLEASSSILLIITTSLAFVWANLPGLGQTYHHFWETDLSLSLGTLSITKSLRHWIDEGLMTIFFLLVGLEIKREVLVGELATVKKALLPVGAAIGGMLFPALIFVAFNHGTPTIHGWGIPMATDIAFALGALYLLGNRVPMGLRVFLSAFAIADDLGAVLVIALFYTQEISLPALAAAAGIIAILALSNAAWVRSALAYAVLGIALWLAVLASGLHATVAGVILALFIPARGMYDTDKFKQEVNHYLADITCSDDKCGYTILMDQKHMNAVQSIEVACERVETPLQRMEHGLQPWVAFLIVPLFGFANAGFSVMDIDISAALSSPLTLGVATGLFLGKPLGITLFSWLFVRSKLASLPAGVAWPHILSAGMLGGLGFTMALFIDGLSFTAPLLLDYAKLGILAGSILSGIAGMSLLYRTISSPAAK
jgi:NhaA family Na+:H+ antiporter